MPTMRSPQLCIKASLDDAIKQVTRSEAQIEWLVQAVCRHSTRGVPGTRRGTASRQDRIRDGILIVEARAIESYEYIYTPVSVEIDPARKDWWRIVFIENSLGTQKKAVRHSFALERDRLIERGGDYRAGYMKCRDHEESK